MEEKERKVERERDTRRAAQVSYMATDEEDDYMSASFIASAIPQQPEPARGEGKSRGGRGEGTQGRIPQRKPPEKIKSFKEVEADGIKQGLANAISQENKGFKMLKMMGYKEGAGLYYTLIF